MCHSLSHCLLAASLQCEVLYESDDLSLNIIVRWDLLITLRLTLLLLRDTWSSQPPAPPGSCPPEPAWCPVQPGGPQLRLRYPSWLR